MIARNLCASLGAFGLAAGMAGAAAAQAAPAGSAAGQGPAAQAAGPDTAQAPGSGLADIVVTARRSSENLQRVPVTITALTPAALKEKAIRDVYDLQLATPSLTVTSSQSQGRSSGSYVIHGQKQAADDASPGVVSYLNDVPVNGGEIARAFFDMESVQVLKGPQGTLFGRNTNGGAVLFNTASPTADFEGYVTGRYGNYDDRYLEAMVNLPLTDTLQVRAAGNFERRDGFTRNSAGPDLDNLRYGNARLSVRFRPNDAIDNKLVFNWTSLNERGPGYQISALAPCTAANPVAATCLFTPATGFDPGVAAIVAANQAAGVRRASIVRPGTSQIRAWGVSDTLQVDLGDLTIKNILGYHHHRFSGHNDTDSIDLTLLSVDYNKIYKTLSDELQVQGRFLDGRLNVIAGGFYYSLKEDPFCGSTTDFCATNGGQVLLPFLFGNLQFEHRDDSSRALFAQASYKLTDTLTATGGYRYTWDRFGLTDTHQRLLLPGSIFLPAGATVPPNGIRTCGLLPPSATSPAARDVSVDIGSCTRRARARFSAGNYLGTLDWTPAQNVLTYVTFRHGYKSGALNSTSDFSGPALIYRPETVDDLEAGFKAQHRFGEAEVRFNASVFHDWYKDLQLTNVIIDAATGAQSLTQNVGAARLWGAEADLVVVPVRNLVLEGTFSWFDGKFTRGVITDSSGGQIDLANRGYQSQPKYSYTLSANYTYDLGDQGKVVPSVFWTWRKGFFYNYDTTPGNFIDSYGLLNARLDYRGAFGLPLDIGVFGKNITNKDYAVNISLVQAFGYQSNLYGEPRTYGIEATWRFGAR